MILNGVLKIVAGLTAFVGFSLNAQARPEPPSRPSDPPAARSEDRPLKASSEPNAAPLIFTPPGYAPSMPAPLIVLLHGYGTTPEDIVAPWKHTAVEFGAILVAPRATRTVNHGQGFSWESVDVSDPVVVRAIDYVLAKYRVDKQRIVLCGFSQGGYLTYELGLRHAKMFCGLIPIAGRYDPMRQAPTDVAANQLPKVFIMVGGDDRTLESNRRAAKDFKAWGMSVKLNVYPGVGHHLPAHHDLEFRKALRLFWPN
ncbi:MAG: prolyl oligopeptidase family serine peptidase [Phycisphaerae bacterium]